MALSPVASASRRNLTLVLLAVALLAQGAFVAWTATGIKPHATWVRLISTPVWPAYGDLRVVTDAWAEAAEGVDPLRLDNDALLYNYPRLWLAGAKTGWRSSEAPWLGTMLAGFFLGAVFAALKTAPGWTRVLGILVMASPAVCLGLERGNTDLLIFALLTPALLLAPRPGWRGVWPSLAILLAAMLKLYPAVLLATCWPRATRAGRWLLAAAGLLFASYLAGTRADIHAAMAKTMKGSQESYGVSVVAQKIPAAWSGSAPESSPLTVGEPPAQRILRLLVIGLIAVSALAALKAAWGPAPVKLETVPDATVRLFLGGVAIYLATFLLGHNWAYRLIFLLWTLPFLGWVATTGDLRGRWAAGLALGLIVFLVWQIAGHGTVAGITAQLASLALILPLSWFAAGVLWPAQNGPAPARKKFIVGAAGAAGALGCLVAGAGWFARPEDEVWRLVRHGEIRTREGRLAEAEADYQEALRRSPDYADAHDQYGAMLWTTGRGEEAIAHFERAVALAPRSALARNNLGAVRRSQRRWDDAIALHQAALAIRPREVATLNQLGLAYLGARRAPEAVAQFEAAREINPADAPTERNLGVALANTGQREQALAHFSQALQLDPDYAEAEMQWGIVLAGLGRLPEALVHLEHAVALAPDSGPAHFFASVALRQLGRTAEADAHYREAVRLDPALGRR